ncbi:MAG: UDP-3-O-(3-hydroxymyristoyl)glucosamine N-acyltransferase [Bryobacteraceae bacterium]
MLVREIAERLNAAFAGDGGREIRRAAALEWAGEDEIAFVASEKFAAAAMAGQAGCLVMPPGYDVPGRTVIFATDPRAAFAQVIGILHPAERPAPGIHPTAVIHPDAHVDETAHVGPYCVVGARSRIGAGCVLHSSVTVYRDVAVGTRTILHAGVVLGADGFGFVWRGDHYENFPQIGRVEIGQDVEIGAHSCVDRAALGVTSIGDGTKLDNLVHIGHNCRIGRHCVIAAQTGLAGGVVVEDRAMIGGQVGVGDKATIEAGAIVGSGAGILTSKIVRAGEPVWGTPARPLKEYLRGLATLARLSKRRGR